MKARTGKARATLKASRTKTPALKRQKPAAGWTPNDNQGEDGDRHEPTHIEGGRARHRLDPKSGSDTPAAVLQGRKAATPKLDRKTSEAQKQILGPFLDFAEQGRDDLERYVTHCAIAIEQEARGGQSFQTMILNHYRLPNGAYDVDMAARDLLRWPPIAASIRKARRESQMISLKR